MDNEDGEDITKEFLEACRRNFNFTHMRNLILHFLELKLGEIVKHENFKLVDSMSATELLDPKMDSGMFPIKESLSLSDLIKVIIFLKHKMNIFFVKINILSPP